jgi:hypothetical protein|eukprot:COSAG01_NODE_10653_length_2111_cov_7.387674_2_plen_262_part_00
MQIFIKTTTGKQMVLEARYTDTVASVKAQIQDMEGIPPAQQCLVYDRMALDDARTLAGCGIQRESTLLLELPGTMRGGGATQRHRERRCDATTVLGAVSLCLSVAALVMGAHLGDRSSSNNAAALDRLQQLESEHATLQSELEALKSSMGVAREELVPHGSIVLWNSTRASVPAGWAECDGRHGTPDLRDRFVVGAGTRFPQGHNTTKGVQQNTGTHPSMTGGVIGGVSALPACAAGWLCGSPCGSCALRSCARLMRWLMS